MNEQEFSDNVVQVAHLYGWKVIHFGAARTVRGWRTPVRYDGKGSPDLVLVHEQRHLVWWRELKATRGALSPEQKEWARCLIAAGANYALWVPKDWEGVVEALSSGRARGLSL